MENFSTSTTSPDVNNAQMDPNTGDSSSTEQFLMYGYKVVACSKRYRHDWSVCPFAHTGEMAARRDPSRYLPIFCFHSKQRLPCPRGDECPYSHNLFEYWLHPQRYRTEMCQFGASCTRPVCFFAHGEHQLRHTGMPGGPQPVVAPPEPNPALTAAGFGNAASADPAVKQQQQLLALQAAAAGFSSNQMRSDSILPGVSMQQHMHSGAGGGSHTGYGSLMDGGGSMDVGALHRQLSGFGNTAMPSSAPLSAPLPQLSPDLIAALHNMGNGPSNPPALSPISGGGLMHQGSGIPPQNHYGTPLPNRLHRSFTTGATQVHAALDAAGVPPGPSSGGANAELNELAKHLAMMQLMQANGANNASAPLPHLAGDRAMDDLLGTLVQLQQQDAQQQQQQQQQTAATAGLDFEAFLGAPASAAMLQHDASSFSCPLPPVFSNPSLAGMMQPAPAASARLPRVPSASAAAALKQHQVQLGGLCVPPSSASPAPSDGNGVATASPVGRPDASPHASRDTAAGAVAGATAKGQQAWSAPVSPCTGRKGGNDLCSAADIKLTSISFTAGAPSHGSSPHLAGSPSTGSTGNGAAATAMPSFSAGFAPDLALQQQQQGSDDESPLLLIGGSAVTQMAQLRDALSSEQQQQGSRATGQGHQQQQAMGQEMAVKLLAQLPEDKVRQLLDLVAQQQ